MWPQALQMSREECRGVLRRLELESYSHVISVFRAQGGLNDSKAKVLEDLRGIFHISQERHRAEARRVANDEQLATIAEAMSGPNTWQEWSREGRRSFPLLPRVAPQTALALIANNTAVETVIENAKLPYPSDTAETSEDQKKCKVRNDNAHNGINPPYVVNRDPFKMPEIPAAITAKKNLKRNWTDYAQSSVNRKRVISEPSINTQKQHLQQKPQINHHYQHITASTRNTPNPLVHNNEKKLDHNHKLQAQSKNGQKSKSMSKRSLEMNVTSVEQPTSNASISKRQATPAKCGRRAQKQLHLRKQTQLELPGHTFEVQKSSDSILYPQIDYDNEKQLVVLDIPQVPLLEKDNISNNFTKLHVQTSNAPTMPNAIITSSPVLDESITPTVSIPSYKLVGDTTLRPSTVQKYVVDDQQSPSQQMLPLCHLTTSTIQQVRSTTSTAKKVATKKHVTQIMQVAPSATASLIEPTNVISNESGKGKVISEDNLIDSLPSIISTTTVQPIPAKIQLKDDKNIVANVGTVTQTSTFTKPVTRKLMPIVLSATSKVSGSDNIHTGSSNASCKHNVVDITKIETLNETSYVGSCANQNSTGSAIINLSASTLLAAGQSTGSTVNSGASGICTTNVLNTTTNPSIIASVGKVFRKTSSNIIKTSGIIGIGSSAILNSSSVGAKAMYTGNSSNTSGPQIISNIKITPAINPPLVASMPQSQKFIKNVASAGLRTPVKICQSPNGKVFIQPASKLSSATSNTFIATTGSTGGVCNASAKNVNIGTSTQRIAIQKVQIIHAPGNSGLATSPCKPASFAIGAGNFGNTSGQKFIVPVTSVRTHTTGTITLTKSGSLFTSLQNQQSQPHLVVQTGKDLPKSNVVVISAAALQAQPPQHTTLTSKQIIEKSNTTSLDALPIITEDTPVDILSASINLDETEESNQVIGVTDWEMELDQATAASKTRNDYPDVSSTIVANSMLNTSSKLTSLSTTIVDNATVFLDDCFEDVIEEEHEDDDLGNKQKDVDSEQMFANNKEAKSEQLLIQEENKEKKQESKCKIDLKPYKFTGSEVDNADAGFDETIADYTETDDENTAIEYIEDDHVEERSLPSYSHLNHDKSDSNKTQSSNLLNSQIYDSSRDGLIRAIDKNSQEHKNTGIEKFKNENNVTMDAINTVSIMPIQDDASIECNNHIADVIEKTISTTVNNVIVPVTMTFADVAQSQI